MIPLGTTNTVAPPISNPVMGSPSFVNHCRKFETMAASPHAPTRIDPACPYQNRPFLGSAHRSRSILNRLKRAFFISTSCTLE